MQIKRACFQQPSVLVNPPVRWQYSHIPSQLNRADDYPWQMPRQPTAQQDQPVGNNLRGIPSLADSDHNERVDVVRHRGGRQGHRKQVELANNAAASEGGRRGASSVVG